MSSGRYQLELTIHHRHGTFTAYERERFSEVKSADRYGRHVVARQLDPRATKPSLSSRIDFVVGDWEEVSFARQSLSSQQRVRFPVVIYPLEVHFDSQVQKVHSPKISKRSVPVSE